MCCLLSALVLMGPRAAILVWGLLEPVRWQATFETFVWPLLGFILMPYTLLMYVIVAPAGVDGFDWVLVGLGVVADVLSWTGSAYGNRDQLTRIGA